VTLNVDSSPPPGSDRPVVDLTITQNQAQSAPDAAGSDT
jgi:hypothetical protein